VVSDYNGNSGSPETFTEEELNHKPEYFTRLAVLEYFEVEPEDLLEADDSDVLNQYEDDPVEVAQDFRRLLATARQGELTEDYEERLAGAIAEKKLERREHLYNAAGVYDTAGVEYNREDELEDIKEDLLDRLWY
jgi:hypothetical protein